MLLVCFMSELNSHLFSVKLLVISHSVVVSLLSQSMSHSKQGASSKVL